MTQVLEAKQDSPGLGHAGRVLDYLVTTFLAAVARAIRHRCVKDRGMRAYRPVSRRKKIDMKPVG
ncbi:hypothetical protein J6524_19545 [Bradyrhizobium sp. WSM 1738]|uniref:hypothetical protein n=1 Tax=Bradyrhizobium hereditatis TaxID=2821405 RepID=UPI001CE3AC8A|nr:hypothetical protein [Bradyrhizobium hereditatis]MCA6117051.1 hypothetical protein [Bradyrhizobium hereditatis]